MITKELLVFEVSGLEFAIPLASVEEVVASSQITPIPHSPPFLLGLSAVRGRVMGVIDASRRYGLGPNLNSYFMVCRVRGNLTAITIDRPSLAGAIQVREIAPNERLEFEHELKVDKKFLKSAYELLEPSGDDKALAGTGRFFFEIHADLFVSAEMAASVGEAA